MVVKACVCTAGVLQFQSKHGYQQARWKVSGEAAEIGLGGEDDDGAMERGGEDHVALRSCCVVFIYLCNPASPAFYEQKSCLTADCPLKKQVCLTIIRR